MKTVNPSMPSDLPRLRIVFLFAGGREARLAGEDQENQSSEFFYGGRQLQEMGYHVDYLEIDGMAGSTAARAVVNRMFKIGLLPNRCRAFELLGCRKLLGDLAGYDVVVATGTGLAFALGIWARLGCRLPPLVSIHCGIFNYPPNMWRRILMKSLLRRSWSIVFGEAEAVPMCETFSLSKDRVTVNQFGVDTSFWHPRDEGIEGEYVLAVGNDARRDYRTLIEASRILGPRIPVKILTRLPMPPRLPLQVEVLAADWKQQRITDRELLVLYQNARVVVTPLHESLQPSGQSVTLQAMACGRPVILTCTSGLWDPCRMRSGENVILVPPGDAPTISRAIRDLWDDGEKRKKVSCNARTSAELNFNIWNFAKGIESMCLRASRDNTRLEKASKRDAVFS